MDLDAIEPGDSLRLDDPKRLLRDEGLDEDEAEAMVQTWSASWFGPGLRVLYTVPRAFTDAILPLRVQPAPERIVRVMVGRIDVVLAPAAER